jgi:hypothetical protein
MEKNFEMFVSEQEVRLHGGAEGRCKALFCSLSQTPFLCLNCQFLSLSNTRTFHPKPAHLRG